MTVEKCLYPVEVFLISPLENTLLLYQKWIFTEGASKQSFCLHLHSFFSEKGEFIF